MEKIYIVIAIISVVYLLLLLLLYKSNKSDNFEHFESIIDTNFIKQFTYSNSLYRPVPSNNLEQVKLNVLNELNKIPNFVIKEQFFTRKIHDKEYFFSNIIGNSTIFNDTKPYIILSAHIDGPGMNNCSASIDAITSISVIIEITKKLLQINNKYNLQVVFFDGEEAIDGPWENDNTLSGSLYFVKNLKSSQNSLSQVFVFDLIGGDIDKNKLYGYSNNPKSHLLMSKLAWTNNELYPENKRIFIDPNESISYIIITDDTKPFYNANIPVIDLIPPVFPTNHHTIKDNYDNVNWNYVEIFANVIFDYLNKNPVFN
jgi:hypothetical protein